MDETLSQLMEETGADTAGLFMGRNGPELMWGVGVNQVCLDRVHQAWRDEEETLRTGRPALHGSWCLWPAIRDSELLLLYLGGRRLDSVRVQACVEGLTELLQTLVSLNGERAATGSDKERAVDLYLRETPAESVERRQLTLLLQEAEWNVARVARMLGVTRVTIYKRMRRLGIERLKIRKTGPALAAKG
jgi:DNA-binding protein Fis